MSEQIKLTSEEVTILNAARTILTRLETNAGDVGYVRARAAAEQGLYDGGSRGVMACGRLAQAADTAEAAVFRVLNIARSYADVEISEDDMHNRVREQGAKLAETFPVKS